MATPGVEGGCVALSRLIPSRAETERGGGTGLELGLCGEDSCISMG